MLSTRERSYRQLGRMPEQPETVRELEVAPRPSETTRVLEELLEPGR